MEIDMGIGGLEFGSGVTRSPGLVSTYNIFAYVPPSAINGDRLRTFDQKYFLAKLAI